MTSTWSHRLTKMLLYIKVCVCINLYFIFIFIILLYLFKKYLIHKNPYFDAVWIVSVVDVLLLSLWDANRQNPECPEGGSSEQTRACSCLLSPLLSSLWPPKAIYIVKSNYPGVMREHLISDLSRAEHIISKKGFSQMKVAYWTEGPPCTQFSLSVLIISSLESC